MNRKHKSHPRTKEVPFTILDTIDEATALLDTLIFALLANDDLTVRSHTYLCHHIRGLLQSIEGNFYEKQ